MTMTGHQIQAAKILALTIVVNLVLNAFLIPAAGIIGAAIATTIATALWNFMMLAYVWRRLNYNPTIFARA
jgi:O-antigen/teichoic acid export membrane protein